MVKTKKKMLNPQSRQNFANTFAVTHNLNLELCHNKPNYSLRIRLWRGRGRSPGRTWRRGWSNRERSGRGWRRRRRGRSKPLLETSKPVSRTWRRRWHVRRTFSPGSRWWQDQPISRWDLRGALKRFISKGCPTEMKQVSFIFISTFFPFLKKKLYAHLRGQVGWSKIWSHSKFPSLTEKMWRLSFLLGFWFEASDDDNINFSTWVRLLHTYARCQVSRFFTVKSISSVIFMFLLKSLKNPSNFRANLEWSVLCVNIFQNIAQIIKSWQI